MTAHSDTPAERLKRVSALDGPEFLGQAYLLVLGRPIDPEGFRNYDAKLRSGTSKLSILAELCASPEGQAHGTNIPDLLPMSGGLSPGATDILELLTLDDSAFIDCAYKTLLRRTPDAVGFDRYLQMIRSGTSKMRIVSLLCLSAEGRTAAPSLQGLRRALRQHRLANSWLIGWWYRPVMQFEGDTPLECRVRAIENILMRMVRERELETTDLDIAAEDVARLLNAFADSRSR
jgi:hypothetical protein